MKLAIAPQLLAKAAGSYLSFANAVPSDHCTIWLDIHLLEICPHCPEGYVKPQACHLQCKDPQVVTCCNQILLNTLNHQNIPKWINKLNSQLQKPSDLWQNLRKELNAINHVLLDAKHGAKISVANSKAVRSSGVPELWQQLIRSCFGKVC